MYVAYPNRDNSRILCRNSDNPEAIILVSAHTRNAFILATIRWRPPVTHALKPCPAAYPARDNFRLRPPTACISGPRRPAYATIKGGRAGAPEKVITALSC